MGRHRRRRIARIALAALALAGCGADPEIEQGSVPFKGTNTSALEPLRSDMVKNMQKRSYAKKAGDDGEPAAAPGATGASKPAGESRPEASPAPTGR